MKIRAYLLVALVAIAALATACTAQVSQVENAPVTSTTGNVTMEQVRNAIIQSGVSLGWQMKEVEPGHIVGTLFLRNHMAQVDIPYNTKAYSIQYKNSSNLKYDGTTIHSRYNVWVEHLNRAIKNHLVAL